eukprot:30957-Pelagococcus_subviridis.AAC.79
MSGTTPPTPGNAPNAAEPFAHGDHRTRIASNVAAAVGSLASVGRNVASIASANADALVAAACTLGGPSHQSPHAPVIVSASNTAGTPARVSGFAAPHSCALAYVGFTEPLGRPSAVSNAAVMARATSLATFFGIASCGHLLSLANCGVLCATQHSYSGGVPSRSRSRGFDPCRRFFVMFETQDTTSEPVTCAPSNATSNGASTTNMSAHTEDKISFRCFASSAVGLTPNAHCSDR